MILAADGICKRYGVTVLEDCALSVAAGECVTVRGVSGGGKSTLLRILARLEPADAGSVTHGAQRYDATRCGDEAVYPFMTLVFQQLFLWPHLTIAENIAMVLGHDRRAVLPPAARALLDRFALAGVLPRRPHECSLGQRQRAVIARALLSEALFILLDEPTSALDRANRGLVADELLAAKKAGRGLLIVTHDERDFDPIADRRLMLEDGRLSAF